MGWPLEWLQGNEPQKSSEAGAATLPKEHFLRPILLIGAESLEKLFPVMVCPGDCVPQARDKLLSTLELQGLGEIQPGAELTPCSLNGIQILTALRVALQKFQPDLLHGVPGLGRP